MTSISGWPSWGKRWPKCIFIEKKNDILDKEPFVECQDCGRKLHQICVLHNESIWRSG